MKRLTVILMLWLCAWACTLKGQDFVKVGQYYVEKITPQGSQICWGYASPNGDLIGKQYFVYGLLNVTSQTQYNAPLLTTRTNDYFSGDLNTNIPALVVVTREDLQRKAAQDEFERTNRVFYISEEEAGNIPAHTVKLPKGYAIYVTNAVSTNLYAP